MKKLEDRVDYKEISKLKDEFDYDADDEIDSYADWFFEYAKDRFNLSINHVRVLEDKADALMRYIGLMLGFIALFIGLTITKHFVVFGLICSLLLILVALIFVLLVRMPVANKYPASVKKVMTRIQKRGSLSKAKVNLALIYGKVTVVQHFVGSIKAKRLQIAYSFFICGLSILIISMCLYLCCGLISFSDVITFIIRVVAIPIPVIVAF